MDPFNTTLNDKREDEFHEKIQNNEKSTLLNGRKALNDMLNDGSVYNTIDYNHFKLAEN